MSSSSKDKLNEDLISAARFGKKDDVERLLRSGADVNSKDNGVIIYKLNIILINIVLLHIYTLTRIHIYV